MDLTDPLFCLNQNSFQIILADYCILKKTPPYYMIYLIKKICLFWLSLYHKQCVFSMEAHEKKIP